MNAGGKLYRTKMQPFRLISLLVWGNHGFAKWDNETDVTVRPPDLSRVFRVSRERIYDYLEWLQDKGYLTNLRRTEDKKFAFSIQKPSRWRA